MTSYVLTEEERKEEERKRQKNKRKRARRSRLKITKTPKIVPDRVAVGPDYHLGSGLVRSRTQLARLRAQKRLTFFNIGSRLAQWKNVADAELAQLIIQPRATRTLRKQGLAAARC